MEHLKRWWWVAAAMLALVVAFLGKRSPWEDRAMDALKQQVDADERARRANRARKEAEADAELDRKRSGSAADRQRGALDRARQRRDRG